MKSRKERIITIDVFYDALSATLAQQKLEAKGIRSFLEAEKADKQDPTGGIEMKVFFKDFQNAFEILSTV
jgi:hypothetical protein